MTTNTANKWNTQVKCTKSFPCLDTHNFQEGNIYTVVDGFLIDGNGEKSTLEYYDVQGLNDGFYAVFKEVKG